MSQPIAPVPDADPFETLFAQVAGPTHWPSIPPHQIPQAWEDLREWVESLVDRFALDIRTIPPCWDQHNAMVEALSALRDHERACYSDKAPPTAAVDWFRAFREIEYQLTVMAARTQCSINEHRSDPPTAFDRRATMTHSQVATSEGKQADDRRRTSDGDPGSP